MTYSASICVCVLERREDDFPQVPSRGVGQDGGKHFCWFIGEKAYSMLADQSPGRVTPFLRHLSLPYLLNRPPSQRKRRPMISACSTKALICQAQASYFLSRHGEVALNSGVVERKPVGIAWMGLKSNKSFLFFLKFLLLYCTYARLLFIIEFTFLALFTDGLYIIAQILKHRFSINFLNDVLYMDACIIKSDCHVRSIFFCAVFQ